jgi:hypothetical protein
MLVMFVAFAITDIREQRIEDPVLLVSLDRITARN